MADTTATTNANTITVGDKTYDINIARGALDYMTVLITTNPELVPQELSEAIVGLPKIGWSLDKIANTLSDPFKKAAKAAVKELSKVDHVARFMSIAKPSIFNTTTQKDGKAKPINEYIDTVNIIITAMNTSLAQYVTANPDAANILPFKLVGGTMQSNRGGTGERRSYDKLADMIKANDALWNKPAPTEDNANAVERIPQHILFGARKLVYPIMIEDGKMMVQYTGPTRATWLEKKTKVRDSLLVNGKTYPLGQLNQLNTQVNGSNLDDDGNPAPAPAINTWGICVLEGITITDGDPNDGKTITNPTLEQFYEQFKSDEDGADDDGANDDGKGDSE